MLFNIYYNDNNKRMKKNTILLIKNDYFSL